MEIKELILLKKLLEKLRPTLPYNYSKKDVDEVIKSVIYELKSK